MTDSLRSPGMRDRLPEEMYKFRQIEDAFRDVCRGWGYDEVRTPTIEHLHLFTAAGTLSPQMLDRVYSFLDWDGWSGERVVVRPDSTIPVARLYVERLAERGLAKLFYVQNVLRFAEGDEQRESWQCGAEFLGEGHPQGDIEAIVVSQEVLSRLGLVGDITLSDPGILRAILVKAGCDLSEQIALYDRVLDGDISALDDVQDRIPGLSHRLSDLLTVEGQGIEYISNLRSVLQDTIPELQRPLDELGTVAEVLTKIGTRYRISPVLVRNFEYYTGPVFRIDINGQKIGGGGRYDGLTSVIGGGDVPAVGLAFEMDIVSSFLSERPESNTRITIRATGADSVDMIASFELAEALRATGANVDIATGEAKSPGDVVVVEGQFLLTKNGTEAKVSDVDEVVRAIAGSGHD